MTDSLAQREVGTGYPRHGGDLAHAISIYGSPPEGWLDLSTGINPNGYLMPIISRAALSRLPDAAEYEALLDAARLAYGAHSSLDMIPVGGTELAIRLLPMVAPAGPVAIIGPTYSSHEDAWRNAGRDVIPLSAVEDVPTDARIVVVCNPNNPDGRITAPDTLVSLAYELARINGLLIVDEAYADVMPDASLVPALHEVPALALRSVGKFYGLAGIRVGFVLGNHPSVRKLERVLGAWPLATPSAITARVALNDHPWREQKRRRLGHDSERLRRLLARHGLETIGGTDLFTLIDDTHAQALHTALAEQGIWTRVFERERRWIRFGLPPEAGFARLDRALANVTWLVTA